MLKLYTEDLPQIIINGFRNSQKLPFMISRKIGKGMIQNSMLSSSCLKIEKAAKSCQSTIACYCPYWRNIYWLHLLHWKSELFSRKISNQSQEDWQNGFYKIRLIFSNHLALYNFPCLAHDNRVIICLDRWDLTVETIIANGAQLQCGDKDIISEISSFEKSHVTCAWFCLTKTHSFSFSIFFFWRN